MNWKVIEDQLGIAAEYLVYNNARPIGTRGMLVHFPGLRNSNLPVNENPKQANTFISKFIWRLLVHSLQRTAGPPGRCMPLQVLGGLEW